MTKTVKSAPTVKPTIATKDAGTVKVGGGSIRFSSTKDAGKVHIGGGSMRF